MASTLFTTGTTITSEWLNDVNNAVYRENLQQIFVATEGQTEFTLTDFTYTVGTNAIDVYVDGLNQYGPGAQYAYTETDNTTITFNDGLHAGAVVKISGNEVASVSSNTILNGTVDPTIEGNVGDFYINTTSDVIFGPKTLSGWGTGTSIIGPTGATGTAATITAGTTTTGAAGTSASVTNSGTSSAAVFDFVIPRGNTGATGATGETGETGNGIASITLTSGDHSPGTLDTYTITYTDTTTTTFQVYNGANGTGSGTVTSVTGTTPISVATGTTTPAISISQATTSTNGYLSSTDWNTFNSKVDGPASSTDNAVARFDSTTGKLIQNSTVTLDDNGNVANANAVSFDITPATLPTAVGSLYWDSADGNQTLSLIMAGGSVTQQIGEEQYYRIKASSAITNGQVVMFTGSVGASGALTGAPATGLTASTASYVMGIATQNIPLNDWGYVTSFGLVRGINTNAFTEGSILYLDPTVAGGLTATIPSAPNPKIQVCACVHQSSTVGALFVRPSFGGTLGQYEGDVNVTTPANGQVLIRNETAGKWVNATLTDGTGISITEGAGSITINNTGVTSYPSSGIAVSTGSAWGTSKTAPSGDIVGTNDSQTLTTKTISGADNTIKQNESMTLAVSDETTAITTGTAKITFRAPYAMTLYQIPRASLSTASSSGNPAVDINVGGTSIFSTILTIDATEKTSTTAAVPAVLSTTSIADDAEITIDIDTAGTGATGLKVTLYYRRT